MNANLKNHDSDRVEAPPLITGHETDEKLRALAMQFVAKCPAGQHHAHCPFRALSGISYSALTNLLASMHRQALLELFEIERECRAAGQ